MYQVQATLLFSQHREYFEVTIEFPIGVLEVSSWAPYVCDVSVLIYPNGINQESQHELTMIPNRYQQKLIIEIIKDYFIKTS